mmetsp:Transcript_43502/g.120279  ORF Transcript_43502/g.120279 Transcript_43502/m.120279 type:complete len:114 (+) Transcript_43502:2340-2681(+)
MGVDMSERRSEPRVDGESVQHDEAERYLSEEELMAEASSNDDVRRSSHDDTHDVPRCTEEAQEDERCTSAPGYSDHAVGGGDAPGDGAASRATGRGVPAGVPQLPSPPPPSPP